MYVLPPPVSGGELQWPTHSSSGLLEDPLPPAAQQGSACQPAVLPEFGDQPGLSSAHSHLLSVHFF